MRIGIELALAALVAAAGCDGERRGAFRGRYVHGFEANAFTECGSAESWSTAFEASHPALDSAIAAETSLDDHTDLYLAVRGRLSGEGSFGHLGGARRELTIEKIETVQPWDPGFCR